MERDPTRAVTERARLLSKLPVEVPKDDRNLLWQYSGDEAKFDDEVSSTHEWAPTVLREVHNSDYEPRYIGFNCELPPGKRLIIDNIIRDFKDPIEGIVKGPRRQVHIYRNSEGYLLAERVVEGRILKNKPIRLDQNEDDQLVIDQDFETRAMDYASDFYNDRKQYRPPWGQPPSPTDPIQLLSTTILWGYEDTPGMYNLKELTIMTPDDCGSEFTISILGSKNYPMPEPLEFRLIEDNSEIAPPEYQ